MSLPSSGSAWAEMRGPYKDIWEMVFKYIFFKIRTKSYLDKLIYVRKIWILTNSKKHNLFFIIIKFDKVSPDLKFISLVRKLCKCNHM